MPRYWALHACGWRNRNGAHVVNKLSLLALEILKEKKKEKKARKGSTVRCLTLERVDFCLATFDFFRQTTRVIPERDALLGKIRSTSGNASELKLEWNRIENVTPLTGAVVAPMRRFRGHRAERALRLRGREWR